MTRILVVTNDFPPRAGGIQAFIHGIASLLPDVVVYAPAWEGSAAFDAVQPFPVVRHRGALMLPVPSVARRAREVLRAEGCDAVWFGAAAPLGLLGPALRRAGAQRLVATTHGHEAGWAVLPGARQLLRRIGDGVDVVTYLGEYVRARLARALSPAAAARMQRLAPGVDAAFYRPGAGGDAVRARLGLGAAPVVVCVSRLVRRKGQDTLIRAMPAIREAVPDAVLLIVGGGPYRSRLERLARGVNVDGAVRFTGPVPWEQLPAHFAAGDVFAMPCRTRRRGLDVEGLGIVFLEASATGLPVVAGDSGGAPDAVIDGETGVVIDGRDVAAVAGAVRGLLSDPARAHAMGAAGRAWVERSWRWEDAAAALQSLLTHE